MHLLVMALISMVAINEVTIEPYSLDNTRDEWVAPGYIVLEEAVFDPLDYGEPLSIGNEQGIGCYSFFVETPQGEKWRLVMTFPDKVVVLQEDEEPVEYQITGDIYTSVLSECGRWVIVLLTDDDDFPALHIPPYEAVMIDLNDGATEDLHDIYRVFWVGSDGSFVTFDDDSLRFYDSNHNQVGMVENWAGNTMARPNSYALNGSILVERVKEDSIWLLRAYDNSGNITWESPGNGIPAVSANGDYVFVSRQRGFECLDGDTGESIWHVLTEYPGGYLVRVSSSGVAWAAGILHENELFPQPISDERMMGSGYISNDHTNVYITKFLTSCYQPVVARALNASGSVLWGAGLIEEGFESQLFLLTSSNGQLIMLKYIDNHVDMIGRINLCFNGNSLSDLNYQCYSIAQDGYRFILFDFQNISIYSVVPKEDN